MFGLDRPTLEGDPDGGKPDAPPACFDNQLSPDETDVDCGGPCEPCAVGESCEQHDDCVTRVCNQICLRLTSCLEIRNAGQLASGIYSIAPQNGSAFDAYCDQQASGGGWTLVMKLASGSTALRFDAPYWTTMATLAETDLQPNTLPQGKDAKLIAFNAVVGSELRLQWLDPVHEFGYSPATARTALQIFMGGEDLVYGNEGDACHGSLLDEAPGFLSTRMRHATGPQFFGINGEDMEAGATDSYMRFGFGSNDEATNTWDPRQAIGTGGASLAWEAQTDCNNCGCYGTAYLPDPTSANLWIR